MCLEVRVKFRFEPWRVVCPRITCANGDWRVGGHCLRTQAPRESRTAAYAEMTLGARRLYPTPSSSLQAGVLAMSKFTPSPAEVHLVNQIFAQADTQKLGVITGDAAVKIFSGSKLSPTVLADIWNLADEDNNGVLTRKGVAVAVRLLGHAQRGEQITEALVNKRECPFRVRHVGCA